MLIDEYEKRSPKGYNVCNVCGEKTEDLFMVHDELWESTGFGKQFVCIRCFEKKICRPLDFQKDLKPNCPCNWGYMNRRVKVAIVGSRGFNNYIQLRNWMEVYYPYVELIISGGAKGADSLAEKYAKEEGIRTLIFKPDWEKYGKAAGFIRNEDIVKAADIVVAFWDRKSRGTAHSIELARQYKKELVIIPFEKDEDKSSN